MTRLGIVLDPIHSFNPKKDTTLVLMQAAQARGWQVIGFEQGDLWLDQGIAMGRGREIRVDADAHLKKADWFQLSDATDYRLGDLDALLMRKDPPFDGEYVYSTYILEAAETQGALVVNKPQSLRDCNEKVFATRFPQCCPPVLVSRNNAQLRAFHATHQDVIFKPLDGMGGAGIFRVKADDPNLGVILETLTRHGRETIMAQAYLPAIKDGDKRILVIDGVPVDYCLARIPAQGETRGNLAAGGTGRAQPLTERDRWIVSQVADTLVAKGLLFVGLDVIGDHLTEINVTSPTCAREINTAFNTDIGGLLMDAIEKRLQ
ncbi:glutathione synthase [Simiduia agarivorans]|uniref:Glutathione synthetase n=1 Tax=Simiduia agarivorans (strain DSM 21679 / JCM 13881 / BCRC 17597 / SA1) TaxID=1117647 RepID=K4KMH1_SIMAS|nr:glutathione synthase [Simiduia agarivorans]AFU99430.1 glutathione synthetase [Simiduia agarivorans SA1 = DSM 21679]